MQISLQPQEGGVTIRVEERRLDAAVATTFKDRVRNLAAHAGDVVTIDLSEVDFLDSSGLGAIIAIFKSMPAGRRLELIGVSPNVERVFKLTRMDSVLSFRLAAPPAIPEPGSPE